MHLTLTMPLKEATENAMPNEFSVKIHNYLTEQITAAEKAIAGEDDHASFYRGQLEELYWIRSYLKENVDLKDFNYY